MSYNTRRTGTGTGRGTTTQVNYHQPPTRPGSNTSTPSRNPTGYTTQPTPPFNSAAQPAFSTQPAFTTTPPLPKAPASQPAAQVTTTTPVSNVKQEPITPKIDDTPKMDSQENGDGSQPTNVKPFWKRKPLPKLPNKVKKARQNAKLRRILNPKNALTFLNELKPGSAKFTIREEPGWGFVATCEIDGKKLSGHGSTVSKAKVQASEQALKHLLLEQLSKSQAAAAASSEMKEEKAPEEEDMETETNEEGGEPKSKRPKIQHAEDDVPWGSLAAFALHKLFAEWQREGPDMMPSEKYDEEMSEDAYYSKRPTPDFYPPHGGPRVGGFGPGPRGPYPSPGRGRGFVPFPGVRGPPSSGFGIPQRRLPQIPTRQPPIITHNLANPTHPMRKIPEDATQRHPVMLLNQLKPNVVYNERQEGANANIMFVITVTIDGKDYTGRGKNKKEAKKRAAMAALAPLGIKYDESVAAAEAK